MPTISPELLGWFSSCVLIVTIGKQVFKQWHEGSSEGVSKWLFIGQITASAGFLIYSILIWNPVFIVTNLILVFNSLLGLALMWRQRKS